MKHQLILLLTLIFLVGCQASGGGAPEGGIISGHTPVDNKFTLTTTMNRTYLLSETINFVLKFPKAVTITGGTPSIDVTLGSTVRSVPLASGDGTDSLTFSYLVVNGDDDLDGIQVSSTLNKNGASIKYDTTFDTSTVITVPNLSTVLVNTVSGSAPVAASITPAAFNEDTQSIMTLSYTDADGDLATSCSITGVVKVSVTQACACAAGVCTVGVTGTLNSNGAAGFSYTVTANSQVSNTATSTFTLNPVADIPVAANITPAAFNEDTQSIITLSYTDGDADLATACSISSPTNVTVTQACACAAGTCTVGVTGTSNYSGAASFQYTVTANSQVSNTATATLAITAVGDAPVAANITPAAFNEDIQSIITLSYTDADADLATACTISSPTSVTVTQACACAAGTCTVGVTGTANYNGAAGFSYTVTANSQTSNVATATLTISPVDDAPVAANITPAAFDSNTQSVITLSYTDVESHLATTCAITSPTNVTVTQACACAAGTCTVGVTSTLNYSGSASFNYTVTANTLVSNSATATLTINSTASAPVAANISPAAFNEDAESTITLSYTDADSDLATTCAIAGLTNVTVTTPCSCSVGVCSAGITGIANHNGAASFTYTVTANSDVSNSATATLLLTPVDDAPVATNITPASFNENVQSIITLAYTDVDSDQATVCSTSNLSNVTVTQACACAAGVCTVGVTGTLNYSGAAGFDFTVTANSVVSNTASATLTILPVADAPVAANITPAAFNEDTQSTITLSYTDAESDLATSCAISSPTNVTVSSACACAAGVCTVGVTGPSNYNGAASFTYTVTANSQISNSATATLTISAVDDAPVATNITPAAFNENTQSIITLAYTDIDSSASACTISGETNVTVTQACACAAGTCTVGVTGTLNYNGAASFNYTVTADTVVSNSATATLTINFVNDPPVAANITPAAFNEDVQSIVTLQYTDADSDLATVCSITSPTNVTVTQACACAAGTCTVGVTGTANYFGAASFAYTVTANSQASNSATATLSITSVDDVPVAANITPPSFNEDIQSIITLSYTDVEDQATACSISALSNVTVTQPCACAAGTCTVGVTGTANYSGAASFNYTVTANSVVSNTATATLTIVMVNDPPVAANITPAAFNEDVQSIITLSYTDPDSDQATTCTISSPSNVSVTQACACAAGICTVGVTGSSNYNGAASFGYTVTANSQTSNTATATLSITPVADAPVAINITPAAFNEDVISNITLVYSDAEGDLATSCATSGLTNITVTTACTCVVGTCTVSVRGNTNYNGIASFNYTVTANSQTSNSATASLTISSVEDAAVATNTTPAAFNEDTQSIITLTHTDVDSQSTSCAITSPTNVTVTQACACASGVCTVGVTGTANYFGAASFAFTVSSNSVTSNSATATLNITSVNDVPTISAIGTQSGNMNSPTPSIAFTVTDVETSLNCASSITMTSSDTGLVANGSVAWSGSAPNCSAIITPTNGASGATTITFTVSDGTTSASSNFTLNINGVVLAWTNSGGTIITSHDFGDPNADATVNVFVKNVGNQTSGAITVTDAGTTNRIQHTGTCPTLAAGATCAITINYTDANPGGLKTETFTASSPGAVSGVLTVTGTR